MAIPFLSDISGKSATLAGSITTNLSSAGTYFTGGSGGVRQLSITSGTNISAHALHTFNIASSNGKYEFDVNGTTELSLDSSSATFVGNVGIGNLGTYKLEVSKDGGDSGTADLLFLRNSNSTRAQTFQFQLDTNKDLVITGSSGAGGFKFVPGTRGTTFAGDVTVNGGDFNLTKQNGSPVINMLYDGNNPSANTLLHHLNFQVDYSGSHQDWGGIEHRTTSGATRTKLNFNVKSTSGNVLNALSLDGTTDGTTATFAGNMVIGATTSDDLGGISRLAVDVGTGQGSFRLQNGGTDGVYFRRITNGGHYQLQTILGDANAGVLSLQSYGGNVGVAELTPLAKLEVSGSIKATNRDVSHTSEAGLTMAYDTSNAIGLIETWTSKPLMVRTYNYQSYDISGTERLRINSSGISVSGAATFTGAISSGAITALAKGSQFSSTGLYVNSTFKDVDSNTGVILGHNDTANGIGVVAGINQLSFLTYGSAWVQAMRITTSQQVVVGANAPRESASKFSVQGGMSEFETTLSNGYDWANSPVSILERGNIASGSSDDKYAPNLNFHWSSRVSNSLWMSDNGHLHYGSYNSAGVPSTNGTFKAGYFHGDGSNLTGVTVSNADTVDNLHAASFIRSDADDTATGIISFTKKAHDYDTIPPNQNLLDIGSIKIAGRNDIYGNATKTVITDYVAKYVNDNTGETTIRIYVDDNILVDGDPYMVSVYYENLIGTLSVDFADTTVTGNGSQTGTSSAPKSGRIYGHATRADYTSTFRFVDINLSQGAGHEVTLHSPKVEAGTTLTDFVATERTDMPTNSMHVRELIATSNATFAGQVIVQDDTSQPLSSLFEGTLVVQGSTNEDPIIAVTDVNTANAAAGVFHQSSTSPGFPALVINAASNGSEQPLISARTNVSNTTGLGGTEVFAVDGDGDATFAGAVNVKTDKVQIDQDGTYSSGYGTVGFGGKTNGFNRVFGATGTGDGLFLASATGRGVFIRTNGSGSDTHSFGSNGYVGMGIVNTNNQRLTLAEADSNGSHLKMNNSRSGGGYWVVGVGDTNSTSSIVDPGGLFFYNGSTKLKLDSSGNATFAGSVKVKNALIDNASVTSATTTTVVASISGSTYAAVFFDYVAYKSSNIRAGIVTACSDGTNVSFSETSTTDLGDTSDVTLSVDISGGNFRLLATTTSNTWNIKSLIRAI